VAQGGGGGFVAVGFPAAKITEQPSITASINASNVTAGAGRDHQPAAANLAFAKNVGGGRAGGRHETIATYRATNTASVKVTRTSSQGRRVDRRHDRGRDESANARSSGGGFLAFADAEATVNPMTWWQRAFATIAGRSDRRGAMCRSTPGTRACTGWRSSSEDGGFTGT
jgi:hypothetical protein